MIDERKSMNINVNPNIVQNLVLENRGKLSVSGVNDVLSFDDQVVMVDTELGLLTVKGENIRINKLSLDTAEVIIEGEISSLSYSQNKQEKNSGNFTFWFLKNNLNFLSLNYTSYIFRTHHNNFCCEGHHT